MSTVHLWYHPQTNIWVFSATRRLACLTVLSDLTSFTRLSSGATAKAATPHPVSSWSTSHTPSPALWWPSTSLWSSWCWPTRGSTSLPVHTPCRSACCSGRGEPAPARLVLLAPASVPVPRQTLLTISATTACGQKLRQQRLCASSWGVSASAGRRSSSPMWWTPL